MSPGRSRPSVQTRRRDGQQNLSCFARNLDCRVQIARHNFTSAHAGSRTRERGFARPQTSRQPDTRLYTNFWVCPCITIHLEAGSETCHFNLHRRCGGPQRCLRPFRIWFHSRRREDKQFRPRHRLSVPPLAWSISMSPYWTAKGSRLSPV